MHQQNVQIGLLLCLLKNSFILEGNRMFQALRKNWLKHYILKSIFMFMKSIRSLMIDDTHNEIIIYEDCMLQL